MSPEGYKTIIINLSDAEREHVHTLARNRGFKITSDYLRSLIEADAKAQGDGFKFEVNRGGYRREREVK